MLQTCSLECEMTTCLSVKFINMYYKFNSHSMHFTIERLQFYSDLMWPPSGCTLHYCTWACSFLQYNIKLYMLYFHSIFMTFLLLSISHCKQHHINNKHCVPQVLCSSEPSMQSSSPSQTNPKEMHSPLVTHLNCCEVHDGGAATKNKTFEEFTHK